MTSIMLLYVGGGILLILLAIPLYFEKVKPNALYGFRVRKTLENPEVWYPVNKYGARWMIVSGLSMVFTAIGFSLIPGLDLDIYALACAGVFAVVFSIGLMMTMRYMNSV